MNEKRYTNPSPPKQDDNSHRDARPISIGDAAARIVERLAKVAPK